MASGSDPVDVSERDQLALAGLLRTLSWIRKGDFSQPIDSEFDNPRLTELAAGLTELVTRVKEVRAEMLEVTVGVSECLQVLESVRQGGDMRVPDHLTTGNGLVPTLASQINATVDARWRQQAVIRELSTPILQIWDNVLALPIIGFIDSMRSADIMENLLNAIVERQTRFVILDITGVQVVDTSTADHFVKLMKAAQLIGAECVLTGIRPAVAQTLVELGLDLSTITTLHNLQSGLRHCLRQMRTNNVAAASGGRA